jgi:hypothetical protein
VNLERCWLEYASLQPDRLATLLTKVESVRLLDLLSPSGLSNQLLRLSDDDRIVPQ